MLTRKDGTPITPENLTDEDVKLSRWSIFDSLATEEDIALYLQAAMLDIEEGECDASFIFDALADAAKARAINQLAKEMGIDRKLLYDLGVEANGQTPEISHDAIAKVVQTFAVPVTV
jgi:probable addiction module antidote protein